MKINLGYQKGALSPDISARFNEIANSKTDAFTAWVSKLSEPFKDNLDWWVAGPASRNTIASPLFHYYCAFFLIEELVKNNHDISEITVDSPAAAKIIEKYLSLQKKAIKVKSNKNSMFCYLNAFVRSLLFILIRSYQFKCAIQTNIKPRSLSDKVLTLIDVFVIPGYVNKDRYYNGLWDNLTPEQKDSTYFVATLSGMGLQNVTSVLKELRASDRNFIIKEDYLKTKDLFFALAHAYRIRKLKVKPVEVLGVDVSPLIKEELKMLGGYSSAIEALLNYRFVQRISEAKLKLRLVIDWWENQCLDKGWNAGFNKYYPQTPTVGYLGYVPRLLELQLYPSESESQNSLLPKKIATIGKGFVEAVKMYYPKLSVTNAPAFRFQHVWQTELPKERTDDNPFTVFVALPLMAEESVHILRIVQNCLTDTVLQGIRFWIKPHPTMSEEKLKNRFGEAWPDGFIICHEDSSNYIPKADILISGTSSICMETLSLGIPVVVAVNLSGLTYNPIPAGVSQKMWRFCKTADEICSAIKFYKNKGPEQFDEYREIGFEIRREYFEPVRKNEFNKFLQL